MTNEDIEQITEKPKEARLGNFIDYFDKGCTPRDVQTAFAKFCDENIDDMDVCVALAPVASGKSRMVSMVANWFAAHGTSSAGIVPTKILQDQFEETFTWVPLLKGANAYPCMAKQGASCADYKMCTKSYCKDGDQKVNGKCPYSTAYSNAVRNKFAIFNYHSYYRFMERNPKDNILVDEAHNMTSFISGMYEKNMWRFEYEFPDFTAEKFNESKKADSGEVAEYLKTVVADLTTKAMSLSHDLNNEEALKEAGRLEQEANTLGMIASNLEVSPEKFLTLIKKDIYRGGNREFASYKDTEQEYLYIKPLDIRDMAKHFFRSGNKVFMFSGTINSLDIKKLGLDNLRVKYFECESPIPAENRPFVYWPIASMAWKQRAASLPKIIEAILNIMNSPQNQNKKGLIHASYDIAQALRRQGLNSDRLMFHGKNDKTDVYNRFLANKTNKVLVASGMDEGIDLHGEEFGFQIISMLMRPNLSDDVNFYNLKYDRDYYNWETIRKILQQTGRICRGPDDKGTTWMIDSQFGSFYNQTYHMWPKYFKDAFKDASR